MLNQSTHISAELRRLGLKHEAIQLVLSAARGAPEHASASEPETACSASARSTPRITFESPRVVKAEFGADALVSYSVTGAAVLVLEAVDRREPPREIPLRGTVFVPVLTAADRLRFEAVAPDESKAQWWVVVRPMTDGFLSIDRELRILSAKGT